MTNAYRRLLGFAVAGLISLTLAAPARAGFEINVFVNGTLIDTITPTSGPFLPGTTASEIKVDSVALTADIAAAGFDYISFSSLVANTNQPTVSGVEDAVLKAHGEVILTNPTSGPAPGPTLVQILVTSTDFSAPGGTLGTLLSTASDTFTNFAAGDNRTFQSYYDPANGQQSSLPVPGGLITPGLQVFVPTSALPSTSGTETIDTGLVIPPFSLTSLTSITLGFNATPGIKSSDQFTSATTLRSVPEPGSVALVLLGLPAIFVHTLRRRRNAVQNS